jgi:hypothetical protein
MSRQVLRARSPLVIDGCFWRLLAGVEVVYILLWSLVPQCCELAGTAAFAVTALAEKLGQSHTPANAIWPVSKKGQMPPFLGFELRSAYLAASVAGGGAGPRRRAVIHELVTLLAVLLPGIVVSGLLSSGGLLGTDGVASLHQFALAGLGLSL